MIYPNPSCFEFWFKVNVLCNEVEKEKNMTARIEHVSSAFFESANMQQHSLLDEFVRNEQNHQTIGSKNKLMPLSFEP